MPNPRPVLTPAVRPPLRGRRGLVVASAAIFGCTLGAAGALVVQQPMPTPPAAQAASSRATAATSCDRHIVSRVSRAALDEALDDETVRRPRLVPHIRDGVVAGSKLFVVQSGSALNLIGLENGDTIFALDGVSGAPGIGDLERALRGGAADGVELRLLRHGCPVVIDVIAE